jgi:hypothetical protein
MKLNRFITVSTVVIICFLAFQCKKTTESTQLELPDISIVDVSQESNWDYWIVGPDDNFYLTENNSIPQSVLYRSTATNKDISIIFNDVGLTDKVVIDNSIFLFDNFNGTKVDIGVVSPTGGIEISRSVETNFNWDTYKTGLNAITTSNDIVNWVGKGIGAIPEGLKTATLASTSTTNLFTPSASFVPGVNILNLAADDATTDKLTVINDITSFVNQYDMTKLPVSCSSSDYVTCATDAATNASNSLTSAQTTIENRNDDVKVVQGALLAGSGDVQITLTWDTAVDMDLWVTDPDGFRIYWSDATSPSGGNLDVDDMNGYGPENIFWPQGGAPTGTYIVAVDYYDSTGPNTHYTVLVQAFGFVKQYEGTLNPDETVTVVTFQSNSSLPKILSQKTITSESKEKK